ncbi:MAG: sugar ABC transporter permease [Oscillospiraceae bacterium]|jgi:arabinogalactan oligomer/maltooligosaccharide transport system permease protein
MPKLNRDGTDKKKIAVASVLFMGLGHIVFLKQYVKGLLFALTEILVLVFSSKIVRTIINLITMGEPKPDLPIKQRDNSIFMLIDGIMILAVLAVFIILYIVSVKSSLSEYKSYCAIGSLQSNRSVITNLGNKAFPIAGLTPMVLLVMFFVIVPLVFAICVAFTNYSSPKNIPPNNTVDWVGLDNFKTMFGGDAIWTGAFGRVAVWTLVWAVLATFTCYCGGMIMAVILKESKLKIAPAFRAIFILPYAIPAVVSMLVWQNLLNGSFGTVNRTLMELGIIDNVIPWLSDATLAKFTAVFINLWAGFPYFMLLITGTMTSISPDIFEAAKIDGASRFQTFRRITFPLVIYQTAPLIIMSFTHNINNFGAIFFLTGGDPKVSDSTITSAKGTDIVVTWIYNLTINLQKYHYAAVLAICIFVVLAPFAIINFRNTKSFKEGALNERTKKSK